MDPVDVEMLSSETGYAGDVSDDSSVTELIEIPKYKCKYCPKRYSKIQALGGHQNAHKKEREIKERQKLGMLASVYQPDPDPYPCPLPIQYALPPGFEEPRYIVDRPDNLPVVHNQCIGSSSSDFARLQIEMGQNWAITGNPYQSVMAQPQSSVSPTSPPVCIDLCLGVGSSSQAQIKSKKPNEKITAEKEDDDLSLSISLKL